MPESAFDYDAAFDRNIGWVTTWEQQALRRKRVAIAGLGGVGGVHLLTLARLGIGQFTIADLDRFDLPNMNRQAGAMMSTLGRPKVEVLAEMARDINPGIRIAQFPSGVTPANIDEFLGDADLFVDGFDFFALGIRRAVFARADALGIPAITAAPIGMGAGLIVFRPGGMSFERYFRLEGQSENEQYLRFLMGVAPRGLHRSYLVDPSRVDLANHRGPSTAAGCQLCAGVVATEALKLLLGRGQVRAAPFHQHFDAYRGRLAVTWLPFGANGPLQTLKRSIARRIYMRAVNESAARQAPPQADAAMTILPKPLRDILELARWTPSGDNAQPWRFTPRDHETLIVDIAVDPANVYEYRGGQPTFLSAGMLLENLSIAASTQGRRMQWTRDATSNGLRLCIRLIPDPALAPDPLASSITLRSVDRRSFRMRKLTPGEKSDLEAACGLALHLVWHETLADRLTFSRLGAITTDIRLRMPETFSIHNAMVDWRPGASQTGIPALALGLPWMTRAMMRWASRDWRRMNWLNRLGGAGSAGLQMDLIPGLRSAAMFTIGFAAPPHPDERADALLRAGSALQRFWLTAERLRLAIHPALAVLAFAHYGAEETDFSRDKTLKLKALKLANGLRAATGGEELVFMGRIGERLSPPSLHRSTRMALDDLINRAPP